MLIAEKTAFMWFPLDVLKIKATSSVEWFNP